MKQQTSGGGLLASFKKDYQSPICFVIPRQQSSDPCSPTLGSREHDVSRASFEDAFEVVCAYRDRKRGPLGPKMNGWSRVKVGAMTPGSRRIVLVDISSNPTR